MCTQAESTYIAHNMFRQIKMEVPWYIDRHKLISKKRDGEPRMIGGQFVVVRVRVHQLSVSPNTSHPMLQICSKLLHGNSMPRLNSSYIQLTPTQSLKSAQQLIDSIDVEDAGCEVCCDPGAREEHTEQGNLPTTDCTHAAYATAPTIWSCLKQLRPMLQGRRQK